MIIDAHTHIFREVSGLTGAGRTCGLAYGRITVGDQEVQAFPPLGEKSSFPVEMLLAHMDWAGVARAVLLQAPLYGDCNQYLSEVVGRYPERLLAAGYLDPWAPDSRRTSESLLAAPAIRAIKLECSGTTGLCSIHPEAQIGDPAISWLWRELQRRDLVLVLDLGEIGGVSYQTRAIRAIAQKHPNLRIVIAHLGQPAPKAESDSQLWGLWLELIDLGRLPNVWFDCAALPAYLPSEDYPYPTAGRYLRLAIERIGPSKVLWGSDAPGLLRHATYPQLLRMAELHTAFLSRDEQSMVLGGNAQLVYGAWR